MAGSWARSSKLRSGLLNMLKTASSVSSFIQPVYIVAVLDKCDGDGLNDCQLFECPQEIEFNYSDLKVPVDAALHPLSR